MKCVICKIGIGSNAVSFEGLGGGGTILHKWKSRSGMQRQERNNEQGDENLDKDA